MNVLMPQLGETVAEGRITTWHKRVGDRVEPGDNLFEVETDKVSMDVPATAAGVLAEIRVAAGGDSPVGAVVAVISDAGGPAIAAPPPAAAARPIALDPFREVRTPVRNFGRARLSNGTAVTPLARRLAAEAGIDIGSVNGSGPRGRVVKLDVEALLKARAAPPAPSPAPLAPGADAEHVKALYRGRPFEEVALDNMRRTIARRLVEAKQTIPHFYLSADVTLDRLLALREEANAAMPAGADGSPGRVTINDFVLRAFALALKKVPAANAVWAEDRILRFAPVDIGVAVAVDGGLLTPVLRDAEGKNVFAISAEIKSLVARARARHLEPHQYQGGAATVSNLGAWGVRQFAAVINPPQATILAVGAAQRRPVEGEDGGIRFATQMTVTLSCDHRVVDGSLGAELLAAFRDFIEIPMRLFM